jgi:lipopolysaccharide assembly protein A
MGGAWTGLALAVVVLIFLLVFILENGKQVSISYLGAHGHLPLGVALLFAAVAGALLVMIPGTGRILQLRRTARRHRKVDAARQVPAPEGAPARPQ